MDNQMVYSSDFDLWTTMLRYLSALTRHCLSPVRGRMLGGFFVSPSPCLPRFPSATHHCHTPRFVCITEQRSGRRSPVNRATRDSWFFYVKERNHTKLNTYWNTVAYAIYSITIFYCHFATLACLLDWGSFIWQLHTVLALNERLDLDITTDFFESLTVSRLDQRSPWRAVLPCLIALCSLIG